MAELFVGLENNQKILIPTSSEARSGNPLGTILAIHSNAVPYGYLPCNGVAFDENQYPALYALLGDNHTPYSYDKSRIGDFQTLSSGSSYSGTMEYDGSLYIKHDTGALLSISITRNGETITLRNSSGAGGDTGFGLEVKKGDVVSITGLTSGSYIYGAFYTHFNVIKATSGLEETQQDYVLQSLLEADSYSTEEVATGKKWIDGKMIYRKVLTATNKGTSDITFDGSISDLDTMVSSTGYIKSTTGTYAGSQFCIPRANEEVKVTTSTGTVQLLGRTTSVNTDYAYLVVEYTKAD